MNLKSIIKNSMSIFPQIIFGNSVEKTHCSLLYIGNSIRKAGFWFDAVCGKNTHKFFLGRRVLFRIDRSTIKRLYNSDLIVIEETPINDSFLNTIPSFRVPEWIKMEIPLSTVHVQSNKKFKWAINALNRYNFMLQCFNTVEMFEYYYNQLFIPYIMERHTDKAFIYSKQHFLSILPNSEIYLLKASKGIMAGIFVQYNSKDQAYFHTIGINSKAEEPGWHLSDIIYAATLNEMLLKGISVVSLGGVHPFVNDGLAVYKTRWGAKPSPDLHINCAFFRLIIRNQSQSVLQYFQSNPFWYVDKSNTLKIAVFNKNSVSDSDGHHNMSALGLDKEKILNISEYLI